MIKINCKSADVLKITDMIPFQGKLKKRTDQDIKELIGSLTTEGLMMPFAIWKQDDKNYLLDGHGRKEAITRLAVDDASLLTVDWPVIFIEADTEDDARKALLQITSQYGKVTKQGYKQFCVSIPEYHAPVINKFVPKATDTVKVKKQTNKTIIRIRVDADKATEILVALKEFSFIEVL